MKPSLINCPQEVATRPDALGGKVRSDAARDPSFERLRLLWEHRQFLFRTAGYGLLAAALIAILIPSRYESTTRLVPPDSQSSSGLAMLTALTAKTGGLPLGGLAGDLLGMKSSGALFVGILRSRTVQERLIERFELRKVTWFGKTVGTQKWEEAGEELSDNTSILEDRRSGIITLSVTDKSPERAAALARAYIEELDRLVAEVSTSAARRERIFLEERLKVVKKDLDAAAKQFSEFASKNTTIDLKEQGRAMVEAAAALRGELIATQAELEGMKQIYTDQNARVRTVQGRLTELERQLAKLGGKEENPADGKPGESDSLYPSIRRIPLLGVTYTDLYRNARIQEVDFEMLTQQYELAKVQEAKEIPTVRVLDVANVPEKKSFPPRLLITLLGGFFALALAAGWVLNAARWAATDPQDPRKVLALEVFTTVRTQVHWRSHNGFRARELAGKLWSRFRGGNGQPEQKQG